MVAFGFYPCSLNKVHQIYKTSYSFKNSHNNDANVVQFSRYTLATSMNLKGLIRSFGDLSNNWMTRTFRELQHLEREWWYGEWQTGGYQTSQSIWNTKEEQDRNKDRWKLRDDIGSHERVSDTKQAPSVILKKIRSL